MPRGFFIMGDEEKEITIELRFWHPLQGDQEARNER
jgi:hypothetical protein